MKWVKASTFAMGPYAMGQYGIFAKTYAQVLRAKKTAQNFSELGKKGADARRVKNSDGNSTITITPTITNTITETPQPLPPQKNENEKIPKQAMVVNLYLKFLENSKT
ncbi:hypothetical protein AGMMS49975_14650 [Clostridia bacterium]|nr:hypothetical protein AGMMS49975_14650 [Clostridia bacterium]